MSTGKMLELTRAWVHEVVDECEDVDTLDLVGKIMLSEQGTSKPARSGGGVVTTLLFGQRVAAR